MSKSKNHELDSWKDVLAQLRCMEIMWKGKRLSTQDHRTYTEALVLCAMVLSDLSNQYSGCGTRRDHVLWCHNMAHTDVYALAEFLSEAIVMLRGYYQPGAMAYSGFKRQLSCKYPFAGVALAPIKDAISVFLANPGPDSFYAPYQFLSFLTHLSLVDIDLTVKIEESFLETEARVSSYRAPEFLVARLRETMQEWLRDISINEDNFFPRHGPGSIAETRSPNVEMKYGLLQPDLHLFEVIEECAHTDAYSYMPMQNSEVTTRCATMELVPKSIKTFRAICKEPATLAYFQQAIKAILYEYIGRHPYLSSRVDLDDQTAQQEMALYASSTGEYATVDLSTASDLVSADLVARVFRDTALEPFLFALRSETVRLKSGAITEVEKFAPMGSALCFPIQTLLFACIAKCTADYVYRTTGYHNSVFRVYGDDIIVPQPCLEDVLSNLRLCGFRINEEKTYGQPARFRESCGCDSYDGTDVSPMKIGRRFSSGRIHIRSAGLFNGLIDMANTCYAYGFWTARMYLIDRIINESEFVPEFSSSGERGLLSAFPTNYRLNRRWSEEYQREEVLAAEAITQTAIRGTMKWNPRKREYIVTPPLDPDESVRLFEWHRLARLRVGDPLADDWPIQARIGSSGTLLTRRWIVAP